MKKIRIVLATIIAAATLALAVAPVYAACPTGNDVTGSSPADGASCADKDSGAGKSAPQMIQQGVNVALFVLGAVAVVMIIYGGIKYSISAGDSAKITSAKNTIMYAIIGLVVAILAYVIVGFVVSNLNTK